MSSSATKPCTASSCDCSRPRPRRSRASQLLEQRVAAGDLELAWLLDVELGHYAVVDQHRIALGAGAHAGASEVEREVEGLGEFAVAVGKKLDLVGVARLLPGVQHRNVIDPGHRDGGDALGLEP